jgi:endonuclease YncB( thermonuclease family)
VTKLRLIVLSALLAWGAPAFAEITGKPRVIDGDTIEVAGQRVRLHGIDAPERGQTCAWPDKVIPCGDIAADALTGTVAGQDVRCETQGKDRYERWIAKCFAGEVDIGENVVYTGWALAYRKYSMDYVTAEDIARKAGRGLWRGKFIAPWEWRRGKRLASRAANDNRPCRIKGNIGRGGTHIYHMPGGTYYSRTRINEGKGERWFCSENEARAAGWRKSKR